MSDDSDDFTRLDDTEFIAERRRVREALEHAPEHAVSPAMTARYQAMNEEFLRRARLAWTSGQPEASEMSTVEADIRHLPANAARMVAIEILLSDPDALDDDVLEACLYVLREKLRAS